jgi:hypothetical protein
MRNVLIACMLALCAASFAASAQPAPAGALILRSNLNGLELDYRVSLARARDLPAWHPEAEEPPLAVHKAVLSAHRWMQRHGSRADGYALRQVQLEYAVIFGRTEVVWYYTVRSHGVVAGRRLPGTGMQAVVLLDGSIVEPSGQEP